jgi:nucleoside-diphosphate-sugar epimerase
VKIFITGIRGFLGANLARTLEARGHRVSGSSSEATQLALLRIGEPVDPAIFADTDTVIHCAHDFISGALERNVWGSRLIFEAAKAMGPRRQIFMSSHSARPDAVSEYGIAKYRIEREYLEAGETVVRPGLVIGAGSMFGRHLHMIRNSRVIPLVDGGSDPVAVLALSDFCLAMTRVVEAEGQLVLNLFNRTEPPMREIVDTVLRLDHRHALIIPVPYSVAAVGVTAAERLRLPLSFDSGSLRSMKLNRTRVHESNLRDLLGGETDLETAIAQSLELRK